LPVIVWISGMASIDIVVPRTLLLYLLTADCEIPRTCATSTSFRSCFSSNICAIRALRAGETVFTATSQGVSNFPPGVVFCRENLFKHAVCHLFYDVCPSGSSFQTLLDSQISPFQPLGHASSRRKNGHEDPRDHRRKRRKHD